MSNPESDMNPTATDAKEAHPITPQRVDSASLFGPARELIIEHNGREYRLRLTQNDKLILTA